MEKIVQTAGRNALGEFAPEFAHFNDDVLFGENWNNQDIDVKTRSIITVVALMASGITDSSLKYHLQNAKNHGVTQKEIAAVITHVAFYAGWPKAWAVFNLAKEVWEAGEGDLWFRPQYETREIFRPDTYKQVVGHTPVEKIFEKESIISTDVFSTYRDGRQIGESAMIVIDSETGKYEKIEVMGKWECDSDE